MQGSSVFDWEFVNREKPLPNLLPTCPRRCIVLSVCGRWCTTKSAVNWHVELSNASNSGGDFAFFPCFL